jgi:D-inositol-3-phosphate glycosyltransferase
MEDSLASLVSATGAANAEAWADRVADLADAIGARLRGEVTHPPGDRRRPPYIRVDEAGGRGPADVEIAVWRPEDLSETSSAWVAALAQVAIQRRQNDPDLGCVALFALVVGAPADIELPPELGDLLTEYDNVVLGLINDRDRWLRLRPDAAPAPVASFDAALALLTAPPEESDPPEETEPPAEADGRPRFLLLAGEWGSQYGGLSTLNRDLATALAAAGVDVRVCVPEASTADVAQAWDDGRVNLVAPDPIPGVEGPALLLAGPRMVEGEDYRPDVIIGHGRHYGPYAYGLKQRMFREARRVHVVHTDAELLEKAKAEPGSDSRMTEADERSWIEVSLARSADLVVGVGPLLASLISHRMRGPGYVPAVFNLRPGLRDWGEQVNAAEPPEFRQVLLVARAEDIKSKGIDIAVGAVKANVDGRDDLNRRPMLVIRGVPKDEADSVRDRVEEIAEQSLDVVLRPYTTSQQRLRDDLWGSRLVIMPSRHEGFGLAAYEAIALGVPVLITQESGLAMMLTQLAEQKGLDPPREVVSVQGRPEEIEKRWADKIEEVLSRTQEAFARAVVLREQILEEISWDRTVAELLEVLGIDPATLSPRVSGS